MPYTEPTLTSFSECNPTDARGSVIVYYQNAALLARPHFYLSLGVSIKWQPNVNWLKFPARMHFQDGVSLTAQGKIYDRVLVSNIITWDEVTLNEIDNLLNIKQLIFKIVDWAGVHWLVGSDCKIENIQYDGGAKPTDNYQYQISIRFKSKYKPLKIAI
jgi:hypothetical protein